MVVPPVELDRASGGTLVVGNEGRGDAAFEHTVIGADAVDQVANETPSRNFAGVTDCSD